MFEDCRSEHLSDSEYMSEALHQYAGVYGEDRSDQEWILSPFDSWEKNPHYKGEPGRHPEDDHYDEDEDYEQVMQTGEDEWEAALLGIDDGSADMDYPF